MADGKVLEFPPSGPEPEPDLSGLSDTDLMNRGRTCDAPTHALIVKELAERHLPRIRALAYQLARDAGPVSREEFAEEVVARFNVKLLEGLLRRRGESESQRGGAYLTRVVRTIAIDYYRELEGRKKGPQQAPVWRFEGFIAKVFEPDEGPARSPRWVPVPLDKLTVAEETSRREDPVTGLSRGEQAQVIRAVVREGQNELGGNFIDIFLRYAVDGLTFDEIAVYLDEHVPAGQPHHPVTVRRHYYRARAVLMDRLEARGFGVRKGRDARG